MPTNRSKSPMPDRNLWPQPLRRPWHHRSAKLQVSLGGLLACLLALAGCQPPPPSRDSGEAAVGDSLSEASDPIAADRQPLGSASEAESSDATSLGPQDSTAQRSNPALDEPSADPLPNTAPPPRGAGPDETLPWLDEQSLPKTDWDIHYFGNQAIGYRKTTTQLADGYRQGVLQLELETLLRVPTQEGFNVQQLTVTSTEESSGRPIGFQIQVRDGDVTTSASGQIRAGTLNLDITTDGQRKRRRIPWPEDGWGPLGPYQSLLRQPLEPGERRRLVYFDPVVLELATLELDAGQWVRSPVLSGETPELLEVRSLMRIGEIGLDEQLWLDRSGEIQKSLVAGLGLRCYRTTAARAKRVFDHAKLQELQSMMLKLSRPIDELDRTSALTLSISSPNLNPFGVLPSLSYQRIQPLDARSVEVTLTRPDMIPATANGNAAVPPSDQQRQASPMLQANAPLIQELASRWTADASGPQAMALSLQKGVHEHLTDKLPLAEFASALRVAQDRQGDSRQHAALLTALLRAKQIPARIAIGLIYNRDQSEPGFVLHMWTEAWLDDRWSPLDASASEPTLAPIRLKLLDTDLADENPYADQLRALELAQQLAIRVMSQRQD
jgi:hypothetical protein